MFWSRIVTLKKKITTKFTVFSLTFSINTIFIFPFTYTQQEFEKLRGIPTLFMQSFNRDAMSRAYYAFFDAASAAFLTVEVIAKTHHGLVVLFDRHFTRECKFPKKADRWLARAKESREEADFERMKDVSRESVKATIDNAKVFVVEVEKHVRK